MRNRIIYIFVLCLLCLVSSCVEKEFFEPAQKVEKDTPIVFTATPKGFTKATVGTRAGEEEEDDGKFNATRFENTIYNAYFLLFDHTGLLRIKEKATINEEGVVSYNVGRDVLSIFPTFRICFLANVPESVFNDLTVNTTTWSNLETYYFDVSYAPFSETACLGVPQKADLNGDGIEEYAMPMFESKVVSAPYNSADDYYSIQLERMFAKVEISMALGIQDDGNLFTSEPQFSLLDCEILNIPKKVPIVEKTGATHYSADTGESNYDTGEISSYTDFEYIIYSSSQSSPSYKSLFFYVPEHKLGIPPSPGTPATQKPNLLEGKNMRPVYAKITGFLTDRAGKTYDATYSIYLGQTNNDNFDLSRNTKYINYVRLNGVSDPEVDHRVVIEEISEMVDNLVDQKGQTANCYIIENNGRYMLPAYKGAYQLPDDNAKLCEAGTNEVLYCDNPNITITIDDRLSKQSTIVFTVTGITEEGKEQDTSPETGNAIIVRYNDNGEIEWSWHLWFVGNNKFTFVGDVDFGTWTSSIVKSEALPDNKSLMDRNIGTHSTVWTANADVDLGLYYQYGKKEPFLGGAYKGGGTLEGDTSWNRADNKKSPTDPCPVGYRVPNASVYEQSATKEHYSGELYRRWTLPNVPPPVEEKTDVTVFRYWYTRETIQNTNNDIFFPYSGYLNGGNVEKDLGLDTDRTIYHANDFTISELTTEPLYTGQSAVGSSMNVLQTEETETETKTYEYTEYQYLNFDYAMYMNTLDVGYLWTSDNAYFRYSHTDNNNWNGFEIIKCDYRSRTITQKQKRTRTRTRTWYIFGYGSWSPWSSWSDWSWDSNSITRSSWSPSTSVTNSDNNAPMIGNINNEDWRNRLIQNQSSRNLSGGTKIKQFSTAPTVGYQVRCVKE